MLNLIFLICLCLGLGSGVAIEDGASEVDGIPGQFLEPVPGANQSLELVWLKASPQYTHGPNRKLYSNKPIIIVHGVFSTKNSLDDLVKEIRKAQPGSDIAYVNILEQGWSLFTPMWKQVKDFHKNLLPVLKSQSAQEFGVHIIGKY